MQIELAQVNEILFYLFTLDINNTTGTSVHCHSKHGYPNGIGTHYTIQ